MPLKTENVGKKIGPLIKDYTWKDVVLYALGVGAGFDELEYCYENQLKVIPSFSIGCLPEFVTHVGINSGADPSGGLHGAQDTIFHNPIPTEGTLTTEGTITHMYDKGKERGAVVVAEAVTYHSNGQKLYTNIFQLFCRKDGGFGGEPGPKEKIDFPDRAPDFEEDARPSPDQPLMYRLSGDVFQLHVDPEFAKTAGFQKPIMHGLCTHGYACRAIIKHLIPGEPERMTRLNVRFSRPIYPGVPIKTQIWKMEDGKALFRVINAENSDVVIDQGMAEWMGKDEMERRSKLGSIRFEDRVAVVTGAGAGLGRVYALELAKLGAKVVVNDLGGARDGTGDSQSPADEVVAEIKSLGGEAVANYDSVSTPEGGQAIVDAAVKAFGQVDILINNAGILRDKTLVKMEPDNWDAVMDVHLKGAYNVTRPAFVKMRENRYGRIIMTSSASGIYGNFGQTNYAAAKVALVGFMNALKQEGEKHNIKVNTIAPNAATRMTEDVMPPDMFGKIKPELVAPMVLYLCSEPCPVTGGIYNAGMGYFSRAAVFTGPGSVVGDGSKIPTLEEVAADMDNINSLEGAKEYPNAMASSAPMMEAFSPEKNAQAETVGELSVKTVFEVMPKAFRADQAEGVDVVFQWEISGGEGGSWSVTVKDGTCKVDAGAHDSPHVTLKMADQDFLKLMGGELNPMAAYTGGKLRIEGDILKSQLIEKLFKI